MTRTDTRTTAHDWEPGRWWRAVAPDGSVWAESSDEDDVRSRMRPGDTLFRQWRQTNTQWRATQKELRPGNGGTHATH